MNIYAFSIDLIWELIQTAKLNLKWVLAKSYTIFFFRNSFIDICSKVLKTFLKNL